MANVINALELDALRTDLNLLIGIDQTGDTSAAKSSCTIRRLTDRGAINSTTKLYDNPTYSTIYTGPCAIRPIVYRRDRQETAGEEALRIRNYRVLIPYDAGDVHRGDLFTTSASSDSYIIGREMVVVDVLYGSENAGRRLTVQDVGDT